MKKDIIIINEEGLNKLIESHYSLVNNVSFDSAALVEILLNSGFEYDDDVKLKLVKMLRKEKIEKINKNQNK